MKIKVANRTTSIPGKIFMSLFLSVFLAAGLFFFYMLSQELVKNFQTYSWKETTCKILDVNISETSSDDNPYQVNVTFSFALDNEEIIAHSYTRGTKSFSNASEADSLKRKLLNSPNVPCFYDEAAPQDAIIEKPSMLLAFFLFIPLIFIFIGAGGIYALWTIKPSSSISIGAKKAHEQSTNSSKVLILFMFILFCAGVALTYFLLYKPINSYFESQSWSELNCLVISSNVKRHQSDDSTTYSIDILYQYVVNGETYTSNQYDFIGGSSSGYESKAKVVSAHPAGKTFTCYVNPNNPEEAVIDRELGAKNLLGLIGPFLILLSLGIGLGSRSSKSASIPGTALAAEETPAWLPDMTLLVSQDTTGMYKLKTIISPMAKFIGLLIVASIFGAITGGILYGNLDDLDFGLGIFLMIFGLVSLGMFAGAIHSALALRNPQISLYIPKLEIFPGDTLNLRWSLKGKLKSNLICKLFLIGSEEARYRRGTNTHTDKNTFFNEQVGSIQLSPTQSSGDLQIKIPSTAIHSFEEWNNKIIWSIQAHAEIPNWPDIKEDYKIVIRPQKLVK